MLTRARRTAHLRSDGQGGFTLIELLIVMVLMGVVGAIVMQGFVATSRASVTAHSRIDALDDLRPATQRVTRELRAADPLVLDTSGNYGTAIESELTRNRERHRFRYYLTGVPGDLSLWADHFVTDGDGNESMRTSGALVAEIVNAEDEPVFSYYDNRRNLITCDDLDLSDSADQATCRDRHLTAAQIRVRFVRPVTGSDDKVDIDTYVNIRNTRYSDD